MDHHVYFWLKEEYQNDVDRAIFEQGLAALFDINLVAGGRWAVPAKVVVRPVIDRIEPFRMGCGCLDDGAVTGNHLHWRRSTLVGMYLSQANSRDSYTSDLQQNRTRRNGKFSHNRERT